MNLANWLTVSRMLLILPFSYFLLTPAISNNFWWAGLICLISCITDMLDGWVARHYHCETIFGTFLDPMVDKMFIICSLTCFVQIGIIGAFPLIFVIIREFAVITLRLASSIRSVVIAADKLGKLKTITQMFCVCFLLLLKALAVDAQPIFAAIKPLVIWVMVLITLVSGAHYLWKSRELLKMEL
ncbi:MAG: CDP-diacylglycerol--glycerol-3-phosphate 3-phosphatidyltransferase [Oscillospiraceae bacterium]|jgi:CDP-diacylglycerol--glycerol-3-phosphate 3-phosphatidyltransferase|nr:CDP-diacylglycerol--glycerol-3-phosphate 3-phosphatidyltransferase [Oscillospiraceae bacterium]